jgi:hypothetical protein
MNSGNSVQDPDLRCAPEVPAQDAQVPVPEEALQGDSSGQSSRIRPPLQDIQEIIDKLAAVTKQLRHPGHS